MPRAGDCRPHLPTPTGGSPAYGDAEAAMVLSRVPGLISLAFVKDPGRAVMATLDGTGGRRPWISRDSTQGWAITP